LDGYKHNLGSEYFKKESELISDLDHFQDRASLVLDKAMEDLYTRTVPYTIPPRLTQYMDEHLETQVTTMVKMIMEELVDQPETSLKIQQQVDRIIEEHLQQYDQQRQQKNEEELEATTQRMTQQLQWIETVAGTSVQLLKTKRDLSVQSIDISMTSHKNILEAKQNKGVQSSFFITLREAIIDMDENRKIIKVDIANTVKAAIQNIKNSHKEIQDLIKEEILKAQDTIQETVRNGMDLIQNNTAKEEGIHTISAKIERGKREIQGDKDRHLQSFTSEKTRIIQQIQTEEYEAMQRIEKATAKTLANIQAKRYNNNKKNPASSPQPGEYTQNQWRYSPQQWTQDTHSQNSNCPSQYGTLQQPSEDQNNGNQMQSQHRFQEQVTQRDQEYQAQQIQECSKRIHNKIHNFKKANLENIVTSDNPSQEEIGTLYRNIAAEIRA
jgi:hypothetical protein